MQYRLSRKLLAASITSALVLAACGDDEEPATTPATDAPSTDTGAGGEGSLAGLCPDTVAIQLDWMPEAEHGFLYELVGDGYTIDASKAYVTGPLVDPSGADTGVDIQIRSGGMPQQFTPVSQIMYNDDDILLGYVYTDEGIQFSGNFPTVALMSGFEKNPQMIMWDPATYPDVETIADLGETGATVRYFGGAAYMEYFTASGILSLDQVDGSYNGDSSLFIADEGKAAQQGFGSAEPYLYESVLDWGKAVKYQYINDAGWRNYAESVATKPENVEKYGDCFTKLIPMIQQASINYLADPADTNSVILAAVAEFGDDFGWTYDAGSAEYGVATIKADGLVANGPNGVLGEFDLERVNELIALAVPIYESLGSSPKEGLTAEDIVTNQFIDTSIGL